MAGKYRGRGLLQITGRENYAKCGAALKLDLISITRSLTQEKHAAHSAAWYFKTLRGCLMYSGDVVRVTQIINGGQNGLAWIEIVVLTKRGRRCWYDSGLCFR